MAEPQRQAFLDANVLRGQLTTDVLLTLADKGAFEPRWSQEVLAEVRRNRPPNLSEAAIDRRLSQMNRAFPQAMVSGYEHLMPQMRADEKDKHVLAAAVHVEATLLVTENVKDFDPPTTGPHAMHVDRTSQFLNGWSMTTPSALLPR
jgi:predicted nucleic acid-binding protein